MRISDCSSDLCSSDLTGHWKLLLQFFERSRLGTRSHCMPGFHRAICWASLELHWAQATSGGLLEPGATLLAFAYTSCLARSWSVVSTAKYLQIGRVSCSEKVCQTL